MNLHRRAKTCPQSRALLVQRVLKEAWTVDEASRAAGVSRQTAWKWRRRYLSEGEEGLLDRRSRPQRCPRKLPECRERLLIDLRREHRLTGIVLAQLTGIPRSTVGRVLRRHRLSRQRDLEPKPAVVRYERQAPGELIHLDIKKLARFEAIGHRVHGDRAKRSRRVGWEYAHVAIDDFSRLSYMEVLPDERGETIAGFLERALAWYRDHGIETQRIMTDNGGGYHSNVVAALCEAAGVRHCFTRPYTPRTNGKAERFIQTSLRAWVYGATYSSSSQRLQALEPWLHYYNFHRPHRALGRRPPAQRVNNLVNTHT